MEKVQFLLKLNKNHVCITRRRFHTYDNRMRNVSNTSFGETQNARFMLSNFFPENRAIYEIISKNVVGRTEAVNDNIAAPFMLD